MHTKPPVPLSRVSTFMALSALDLALSFYWATDNRDLLFKPGDDFKYIQLVTHTKQMCPTAELSNRRQGQMKADTQQGGQVTG